MRHPIALCILGIVVANAATTPWMLGDETTTACYTLDTNQDIPLPAGLDMRWVLPLPDTLDTAEPYAAEYAVTVDDAVFWTDPANVALLGGDLARWREACNATATVENTGCSGASCCVWHSNLHSCLQSLGTACEPWVTPRNGTLATAAAPCGTTTTANASTSAPVADAVLVTHTAAQVGVPGPYIQHLQLPEGSWVTIAHVKIMNFQCAVGALRRAIDPLPPRPADTIAAWVPVLIAAVVLAALATTAYGLFVRPWLATRHAPSAADCASGAAGVSVVTLPAAEEVCGAFPAAREALTREFRARVAAEARAAGCYVARRQIGAFGFVVVARTPAALVRFGASLQHRMHADARQLTTLIRKVQIESERLPIKEFRANYGADNSTTTDDADLQVDIDDTTTVRSASTRKSKRSVSRTAHPLAKPGALEAEAAELLRASVAVHAGKLDVMADDAADGGALDYGGAALTECAFVADACQPGQVLVSQPALSLIPQTATVPCAAPHTGTKNRPPADAPLHDHCTFYTACALADTQSPAFVSVGTKGTDDDGNVELFTIECGAYGGAVFAPPAGGAADNGETDAHAGGIAAQLQRSTGALATAPVTILYVDTGVALDAGARAGPVYQATASRLVALAERHGGHLHATEGTRLVFTFNAQRAVRGHARKAALAAADMADAKLPQGADPSGALATGKCTFGTLESDVPLLCGPAVDAARALFERSAAFQRDVVMPSHSAAAHMMLPASHADIGGHDYDNSNNVKDAIRDDDVDETIMAVNAVGSPEESTLTCSELAAAHLRRNGGPRFVCGGYSYADLQHTVTLVIMDVSREAVAGATDDDVVAHATVERGELSLLVNSPQALNASGRSADNECKSPRSPVDNGCAVPLSPVDASIGKYTPRDQNNARCRLRDSILLVGIVGRKETRDDDEWQYDLAKAEAASPEHAVSEAFVALLRGKPALATAVVAKYASSDGCTVPPRSVRPSLTRLRQLLRQLLTDV